MAMMLSSSQRAPRSYADFVVLKYDPDDDADGEDLFPATSRVIVEQVNTFAVIAARHVDSEVWIHLKPTIAEFLFGKDACGDLDVRYEFADIIVPELDAFAIQRLAVVQRERAAEREYEKAVMEAERQREEKKRKLRTLLADDPERKWPFPWNISPAEGRLGRDSVDGNGELLSPESGTSTSAALVTTAERRASNGNAGEDPPGSGAKKPAAVEEKKRGSEQQRPARYTGVLGKLHAKATATGMSDGLRDELADVAVDLAWGSFESPEPLEEEHRDELSRLLGAQRSVRKGLQKKYRKAVRSLVFFARQHFEATDANEKRYRKTRDLINDMQPKGRFQGHPNWPKDGPRLIAIRDACEKKIDKLDAFLLGRACRHGIIINDVSVKRPPGDVGPIWHNAWEDAQGAVDDEVEEAIRKERSAAEKKTVSSTCTMDAGSLPVVLQTSAPDEQKEGHVNGDQHHVLPCAETIDTPGDKSPQVAPAQSRSITDLAAESEAAPVPHEKVPSAEAMPFLSVGAEEFAGIVAACTVAEDAALEELHDSFRVSELFEAALLFLGDRRNDVSDRGVEFQGKHFLDCYIGISEQDGVNFGF